MRIRPFILAATILSSVGVAQNHIEIYPGVASFTSRGSIQNDPSGGELLQGLPESAFAGIGDDGSEAKFTSYYHVLQDNNAETQERYHVVCRSGTDTHGPDATPHGLEFKLGPILSPPRGAGPVTQAWTIHVTFPSAQRLPVSQFVAFGLELEKPAGAGWTQDGLSIHMSRGDGGYAQTVQCAAPSAPDMAYQIRHTVSGPVVSHPSHKRSWRFGLGTDAGTLQMGNTGSKYGVGGSFPDFGVPLSARARFGPTSGATSGWVFLSNQVLFPGFSIQPGMRVYLNPAVLVGPFATTVSGAGEGIFPLGITPSTPTGITLHLQAAGIGGPQTVLTNACTVTLQ